MKSSQIRVQWLVVLSVTLMFSVACNDGRKATQPDESRFELKQDAQGRIVRLDKVTGTTEEVISAPAVVAKSQKKAAQRVATKHDSGRLDGIDPVKANAPKPVSSCSQSGNSTPKKVTVSTTKAPVFIEPRILQIPLTELSTGAELSVVQGAGDWYLVNFEDQRWGPRVGYIHCTQVRLGTSSHNRLVTTSSSAGAPAASPQIESVRDDRAPISPAVPATSVRGSDARTPTQSGR
jgi:hypothetical protein